MILTKEQGLLKAKDLLTIKDVIDPEYEMLIQEAVPLRRMYTTRTVKNHIRSKVTLHWDNQLPGDVVKAILPPITVYDALVYLEKRISTSDLNLRDSKGDLTVGVEYENVAILAERMYSDIISYIKDCTMSEEIIKQYLEVFELMRIYTDGLFEIAVSAIEDDTAYRLYDLSNCTPVDSSNNAYLFATFFILAINTKLGKRIHLDKNKENVLTSDVTFDEYDLILYKWCLNLLSKRNLVNSKLEDYVVIRQFISDYDERDVYLLINRLSFIGKDIKTKEDMTVFMNDYLKQI